MEKIIFTLEQGNEWIPKEYYPVPAAKLVPDWYKKMPSSYAKDRSDTSELRDTQTMKRCMPIIDAITGGYIIKTFTDLHVKNDGENLSFNWAQDYHETITFHPEFQVKGYKDLSLPNGAPKLRNPWGIQTPSGYSCLFISPMHRPSCGIKILEGIVDTDGYLAPVQFPFLVDKNFTGLIPAGTPVVQVVPFKRTSFRMEIGAEQEKEKLSSGLRLLKSTFVNGYRNKWRVHKDYL